MRTSRTGKSAFTIVELIVVVIVIGVLAGMIAPRLVGAGGATRLRSTARRLQATAAYARDYAATHRRTCRLAINASAGEYALLVQDDPEHRPERFVPLTDSVGRCAALEAGVTFGDVRIARRNETRAAEAAGACVDFTPLGLADAAVIEVTNERLTYSILITPETGRVRLIEGTEACLPDEREDLDA